jgi:hypothetical protein
VTSEGFHTVWEHGNEKHPREALLPQIPFEGLIALIPRFRMTFISPMYKIKETGSIERKAGFSGNTKETTEHPEEGFSVVSA